MWSLLFVIVLLAVPFSTLSEETEDVNSRQARYAKPKAKSELPLLLIRPVNRGNMLTNMFRSGPSSKASTNDDISMLGSILPQLGLDPLFYGSYSVKGSPHIHIQPVKASHYYNSPKTIISSYFESKNYPKPHPHPGHQLPQAHPEDHDHPTITPHPGLPEHTSEVIEIPEHIEHKEHPEHTEHPEHKPAHSSFHDHQDHHLEHPNLHVQPSFSGHPDHQFEHPKHQAPPSFSGHKEHHLEHPKPQSLPSFSGHQEHHFEQPKLQGHPSFSGHQDHHLEHPKPQGHPSFFGYQDHHLEHPKHQAPPSFSGHQEHHFEQPKLQGHPSFPGFQDHHFEHPKPQAHPSFQEHLKPQSHPSFSTQELHQTVLSHQNFPSHVNRPEHQKLQGPPNFNGHLEHQIIQSHPNFNGYHEHARIHEHPPVTTPSYMFQEHYFTPKPIDFSLIKNSIQPTEELVIGKPSFGEFKPPSKSEFYVAKDEQTASFEVKSKTENVKFVPPNHSTHFYYPKEINTVQSDEKFNNDYYKSHYLPQKTVPFSSYKKTPQIDFFIPKDQDSSTNHFHQTQTESQDYYKKFDTEEYFLPKLEPEYHKMSTPSYSFKFHDKGFGNIRLTDHIFSEHGIQTHIQPQALHYTANDPHYGNFEHPPMKHDNLFETKLTAHDYVKSSIKSNENKTKTTSNYGTSAPTTISDKQHIDEFSENFFDSIKGHEDEFYYTTPKLHQQKYNGPQKIQKLQPYKPQSQEYLDYYPTSKPTKGKENVSIKTKSDVRPVFENIQDEITITTPTKLYLNDRSNSTVSEITTIKPLSSSAKIEIRFPSKITTPRITTYKQKLVSKSTTNQISTTTLPPAASSLVSCERQCIQNTVSQEYDPVCGTDNKTYSNKGKLRCTRNCAKNDVTVKYIGACGRNSSSS